MRQQRDHRVRIPITRDSALASTVASTLTLMPDGSSIPITPSLRAAGRPAFAPPSTAVGPAAANPFKERQSSLRTAAAQGRRQTPLTLIACKPDPRRTLKDDIGASFDVEVRTLPLDVTSDEMLPKVAAATDGIEVGLLIYNVGASAPCGSRIVHKHRYRGDELCPIISLKYADDLPGIK